jgi:hypothetical protein
MGAAVSSETLVNSIGLHGVTSQNTVIFKPPQTRLVVSHSVFVCLSDSHLFICLFSCSFQKHKPDICPHLRFFREKIIVEKGGNIPNDNTKLFLIVGPSAFQ